MVWTSFENSNLDTKLPDYRELISPLEIPFPSHREKGIQRYSYSLIVNTERIPSRIPPGAIYFQRNSIKGREMQFWNRVHGCINMHPKIHILLLSLPLKKEQRVDISYARNVRLTFHFPLARSPSPSTIDFNNFIVAPTGRGLCSPLSQLKNMINLSRRPCPPRGWLSLKMAKVFHVFRES